MQSREKLSDSEKRKESTAFQLAKAYRDAAPYLNIGWFFLISILLFLWLGKKLDEYLLTEPLFLLTGTLLGFLLGFLNLYKTYTFLKKKK